MNANVIIEPAVRRRRRRHSDAFKAEVIQACRHPGVSIAAVALSNGLNANLVRRWVANAERGVTPVLNPVQVDVAVGSARTTTAPAFVPLQLPAPASERNADIQIELCRAGTTIKVRWPANAASECAAWLRELLR